MNTWRFIDLTQAHGSLYEAALAELFATVGKCSAGLVAKWSPTAGFEVLASRGLGAEPLRTLLAVPGGIPMLSAAVKQACWATLGGDLMSWAPGESALQHASARARQARARLIAGMACPIASGTDVVGVLALYGRQKSFGGNEQRRFVVGVSHALADIGARPQGANGQRRDADAQRGAADTTQRSSRSLGG
jgi:hypothetical protein